VSGLASSPPRMKLVICWTEISGYMNACWKALASRPGIDLHVVCFAADGVPGNTRFRERDVHPVSVRFLNAAEQADAKLIEDHVAGQEPDVVMVTGWAHKNYCRLVHEPRLAAKPFVMAMDTPWRGDFRQRLAPWALRPFLRRVSAAIVAGERSRQYALRLGIPAGQIHSGIYAYDESLFNGSAYERRREHVGGWPKRFLYVGRYVPEKAIDVLARGYAMYREQVAEPWPLDCCGMGVQASLLTAVPGVTDMGFVQPPEQPRLHADHAVLLLPSRYEPWGVVVAEAMATGMPVICSTSCGAAAELVRPYFNGLVVPTEDAAALAHAMRWMHEHHARLPELGRNAMHMAPAHSAGIWAERVHELCLSLSDDRSSRHA
jgi:glycosyltransferase involved in cell wall biosynthesis